MNKNKIKKSQSLGSSKELRSSIKTLCFTLTIASIFLCANEAMAADAFETAFKKIVGWTEGTLGKLIMFVSLIGGTIMGALGFSWKTVAGPIGIGLILSLAKAITEMVFKTSAG